MTESQEIANPNDDGPAAYLAHIVRTRHRAVQDVARWFDYRHLPKGLPRTISVDVTKLACSVIDSIDVDDPELTRGLSHLLSAKDALVRAAIVAADTERPVDL